VRSARRHVESETQYEGEHFMAISATQIRRGSVIVHGGEPCRVLEKNHIKPGKGPAYVQAKLRNILTGVIFENRFRAADTVEPAAMETQELQYLYKDTHHYYFMHNETFEQIALDNETLGDAADWLTENLVVQVEFFEGKPIGIELPKTLELEVVETEPGVRGDTRTSVTKPAKLENGVTIQVPAFVDKGDVVRVDPEAGTYLERAR
jgi:elongation factor P